MNLLQGVKRLFTRPRIETPAQLEAFFEGRAAFIAQKCVVEYSRARAGLNWQRLFSERPFQEALHTACWRAWQVTLLDVAEMLDAVLRRHVPSHEALLSWLAEAGGRIVARQEIPPALPADFRARTLQQLETLLAELKGRAALPVKDIACQRAAEVFNAIPIHPTLKAPDVDYVRNTLRVFLTRACDDLQRLGHPATLARRLG